MRMTVFIPVILFVACNNNGTNNAPLKTDTVKTAPATNQVKENKPEAVIPAPKTYSNKRFRG